MEKETTDKLADMVEITNVKVYDLKESVIASRNAMRLTAPEYTQQEFEEFKDEIKRSLHRRLRRKFTTAQIQTSPAPNIGQYVTNAIRNISRRY